MESIDVGMNKTRTVKNLNEGCEDEMTIEGYRYSKLRHFLTVLAVLLSAGLLGIVIACKERFKLKAKHIKCPLPSAEKVLLMTPDKQEFVEKIIRTKLKYQNESKELCYFVNKKLKYVWDRSTQHFYKVHGMSPGNSCSFFYKNPSGLSSPIVNTRLQFYGENSIEIEVRSIFRLLIEEALNPFYIYQLYTVVLWCIQLYYQFAIGVLLMSLISIVVSVWETRRQSMILRSAVHSHSVVNILREGKELKISSRQLVPGDVILIPSGNYKMECDAVLINGTCIVNESSLTGESIPVSKNPISNSTEECFSEKNHKRHMLFCGTTVLQTRCVSGSHVKAVVIKTGFCTIKGELVRAILFPKPLDLKFYSDFFRFFIIFICLGLCAFIYSIVIWTVNKGTIVEIIVCSLDILTFVVPPILPAAYTSITAISQKRLRRNGIFCLSSKYINLCGGLDLFCFDKTGTLTDDSLDLTTVIPVESGRFQKPVQDPTHLPSSNFLKAMATCHSLTKIDGNLSGYPLDVKIFEAINWELDEPETIPDGVFEKCSPVVVYPKFSSDKHGEDEKTIILKKYPFESGLQRMSVLTRKSNSNQYHVFVKGAPEKIASLCKPNSVPAQFQSILPGYTKLGFRVLAVAWKPVDEGVEWETLDSMPREQLEEGFEFLGLLILQNLLKPETKPVLQILNNANIRSVMVTGDNILTAISVATDCDLIKENEEIILVEANMSSSFENPTESLEVSFKGFDTKEKTNVFASEINLQECKLSLIPEKSRHRFAIDGHSFALIRTHNRDMLKRIVLQGSVFARMLPEQKIHLVESFQELGFQVGMCGDGANDCGALKVAHAGVSLCEAESSIASPFTSKKNNILCVPRLISEGRASLVSCIGVFKYEVAYCFSMLFMALILFWVALKPTDPQYIYIDMILNIVPPVTFGMIGPCSRLSKEQPEKKLLAVVPLASIFSFLIIQLITYIVVWNFCQAQPWFEPFKYSPGNFISPPSYEGTAMFSISLFSYFMAAIVFSQGPPFRKPLYHNWLLSLFLFGTFVSSTFIIIAPGDFLINALSLKENRYFMYSMVLFGIGAVNALFSYVWELYVIRKLLANYILPIVNNRRGPSTPHGKLEIQLNQSKTWPPIGSKVALKADGHLGLTKKETNRFVKTTDPSMVDAALHTHVPRISSISYGSEASGDLETFWKNFCP